MSRNTFQPASCQVSVAGNSSSHWHWVMLEKMLRCSLSFLSMTSGPGTGLIYWQLKATSWHLHGQVKPALGSTSCFKSQSPGASSHEVLGLGLGPQLVSFLAQGVCLLLADKFALG